MRAMGCVLLLGCAAEAPKVQEDDTPTVYLDDFDAYATVVVNEVVASPYVPGGPPSVVGALIESCTVHDYTHDKTYEFPPEVHLLELPLVGEGTAAQAARASYIPNSTEVGVGFLGSTESGGPGGMALAWETADWGAPEFRTAIAFGTAEAEDGALEVESLVQGLGGMASMRPWFIPDFNGDGIDDLYLAGSDADTEDSFAYLLPGPINEPTEVSSGAEFLGAAASLGYGYWTTQGDLDGDGYGDLSTSWGIYFGRADLSAQIDGPQVAWAPAPEEDWFGVYGTVVGDLDGDGADDIGLQLNGQDLVGFPDTPGIVQTSEPGVYPAEGDGRVLLYTGIRPGVLGPEDASATLGGHPAFDAIRFPLAGVDLDGSGRADLVVGYAARYGYRTDFDPSLALTGLALFLDPMDWAPDISFLNADLSFLTNTEGTYDMQVFENNGDGVPDFVISGYVGRYCEPGPAQVYDGAQMLGALEP